MATGWQVFEVGDTCTPTAGPAEADQCKSSEFLHELRISSFHRVLSVPHGHLLGAKLLWIDAIDELIYTHARVHTRACTRTQDHKATWSMNYSVEQTE